MNCDTVAAATSRKEHSRPRFQRWHPSVLCSLLAASVFPSSTAIAEPPKAPLAGYRLAWAEEFDGDVLDKAKWTYRTDSKHLSTQKPENVSVQNGLLHLQLKKEAAGGKKYTGAGIISREAFKYGYFEARLKMPARAASAGFTSTRASG